MASHHCLNQLTNDSLIDKLVLSAATYACNIGTEYRHSCGEELINAASRNSAEVNPACSLSVIPS